MYQITRLVILGRAPAALAFAPAQHAKGLCALRKAQLPPHSFVMIFDGTAKEYEVSSTTL
jgi:hypothetical protein